MVTVAGHRTIRGRRSHSHPTTTHLHLSRNSPRPRHLLPPRWEVAATPRPRQGQGLLGDVGEEVQRRLPEIDKEVEVDVEGRELAAEAVAAGEGGEHAAGLVGLQAAGGGFARACPPNRAGSSRSSFLIVESPMAHKTGDERMISARATSPSRRLVRRRQAPVER